MRDFLGILLIVTISCFFVLAIPWILAKVLAFGGPIAAFAFLILTVSTIIFILTR